VRPSLLGCMAAGTQRVIGIGFGGLGYESRADISRKRQSSKLFCNPKVLPRNSLCLISFRKEVVGPIVLSCSVTLRQSDRRDTPIEPSMLVSAAHCPGVWSEGRVTV